MTLGIMSKNLVDTVDKPIQKIIAMMNLLGIKTVWSCCGFDYKATDKSHLIGQPQIWIKSDYESFTKLMKVLDCELMSAPYEWIVNIKKMAYQEPLMCLFCKFTNDGVWDKNSIHFHEQINVVLKHLEDRLMEFKDEFADEVVVEDQNKLMKQIMKYWQVEDTTPWIIRKNDIGVL